MTRLRIADIVEAAVQVTGLSRKTIRGKSRLREYVHVRAAIAIVARGEGHRPALIGHEIGGRDRTTVIHLIAQAPFYREHVFGFDALVARIRNVARGSAISAVPKPVPLRSPIADRIAVDDAARLVRTKPKNNFIEVKEPDAGHVFQSRIAKASQKFAEAIISARNGQQMKRPAHFDALKWGLRVGPQQSETSQTTFLARRRVALAVARKESDESLPRVSRDPCPFCAVRADLHAQHGCRRRIAA